MSDEALATEPATANSSGSGELREALEWYGEQARLARLIHSEGDAGRHALAADGGKRAREALSTPSEAKPDQADIERLKAKAHILLGRAYLSDEDKRRVMALLNAALSPSSDAVAGENR